MRALRAAPLAVRLPLAAALVVATWFVANGAYQVARKPTELFFPVSGALNKTPDGDLAPLRADLPRARHRRRSRPTFLAALAQVEGVGQSGRADLLALVG